MLIGSKDHCNQQEDMLNFESDNDQDEYNNEDLIIRKDDKEIDEKVKAVAVQPSRNSCDKVCINSLFKLVFNI